MRFRFTAVTQNGEERAGFLTADDRDSASRQLERRGLVLQNLEEAQDSFEASPTTRMPAPQLKLPSIPVPDWRQHLAGVDARRLGIAAAVLLVLLSGLAWGIHRVMGADKVYHLKLTGECKVETRRTLPKEYWKRVRPHLWLPKPEWYISSTGAIFAKDKQGKWQVQEQRAKVNYQGSNEGNYTLEIDVALAVPPQGATIGFTARGYSRGRKQVVFQPQGKVYTAQVSAMALKPRWGRRTRSGSRARQRSYTR